MVTTVRRAAKPVSLVILMLFAVGPGFVSAGPQPAAAVPSRPFAAYSWTSSAGLTPVQLSRSLDDPPLWNDANAAASTPAKSGSWWSRRTTAQKTWFIVGIVAGAAGIYAIANHHSGGGSGGGGGY